MNRKRAWHRLLLLALGVVWMMGCDEEPTSPPPVQLAPDASPVAAVGPVAEPVETTRVSSDGYAERWNYMPANLASDKGCEEFINNLKRSADVHCTHILMVEGRSMRFPDDEAYLDRVEKVKAAAEKYRLTLVPSVISVGYAGRYFHYDANLAAGVPVRDMPMVVQGGKAAPDPALTVDTTGLQPIAGGGLAGAVTVKPFQHYKLTFRLTGGQGIGPRGEGIVEGRSSDGKRQNCVTNPVFKADGPALIGLTTFNSLEGEQVALKIDGKGWKVSDVKIESAGLLLILRRELLPLTVTSEDGLTVYAEGRDFEKIIDPCLKVDPFPGEVTNNHLPAELILTRESRIQEGQKLKLSFWHTIRIYDDQDSISLEDPRTFPIFENEFVNLHKVWGAKSYFMNYDEIRMGGWEPQPGGGEPQPPGALLAAHFKRNYDMIRKHLPDAKLYTWSDMFTPYHNARPFAKKGYYYLVNGNYDGSWKGVPKDVVILNWYSPDPEGVQFFAERGYQQVFCGYYDQLEPAKIIAGIDRWKRVSKGQPGILGFMYTTWKRDYRSLNTFFTMLDAYVDETARDGATEPPPADH